VIIDDLAKSISRVSQERDAQRLSTILIEWKADNSNVELLCELVEHYIGNVWLSSDEIHQDIYRLWSSFRDESISNIGGMTMNERLYCFGLLERFDHASSTDRKAIYEKLHATP
jgi:hypothetical protein